MAGLNLKLLLQAVDRASGPVNRVAGSLGGLLGRVDAVGRRMAKIGAIGGLVAGSAAVGGAMVAMRAGWSMVKEAADAGDAALNNAQKIGLTVGAYQRLTYAARLANMGNEEFSQSIGILSGNLYSAAHGGKEDAASFRALGVAFKDAHGRARAIDAVLPDIADRFASMPDGPEKTALAMRVLGRAGKDMIPFLNQGGAAIRAAGDEAERFGVVMTEDQARAADEFNDNMDRMRSSVLGLKVGIGNQLLPQINAGVVGVTAWIAAHRSEILAKVGVVVGKLSAALAKVDWVKFGEGVVNVVVGVVKLFEWIGGLHGIITTAGVVGIGQMTASLIGFLGTLGVLTGPIGWTIAAIGALAAGAFVVWRNWDHISKWFAGAWNRIATTFSDGAKAVWNAMPSWLQFILRGVAFAVRFANPVTAAMTVADAARAAGARPQPAVGPRAADGRVNVNVRVDQDGRLRGVTARASGPGISADAVARGAAMGGF